MDTIEILTTAFVDAGVILLCLAVWIPIVYGAAVIVVHIVEEYQQT